MKSPFTAAELERSRRYHRPLYTALVADLALALATLAALTRLHLPLRWWLGALVTPVVVDLAATVVRLPLAWWRYRRDRTWELTSQGTRAWAADRVKAAVVGSALAVAGLAPLFAAVQAFPHSWPWVAAPGAAAFVFVAGFLAPVLLEPVFNRFSPLEDPELAARLHAVAERAETPVRAILVADASRRTRRQNAYVSGLGRTRRVVLWDTLLASPAAEIEVVLAHELGHRARRHVAALTALGMAGAAGFVIVLRLVLPAPAPRDTAAILLLAAALELVALPLAAGLSRRLERSADAFSLRVTGDRTAFRALHRRLALENLADLAPPRWLQLWLGTHPTPVERLGGI